MLLVRNIVLIVVKLDLLYAVNTLNKLNPVSLYVYRKILRSTKCGLRVPSKAPRSIRCAGRPSGAPGGAAAPGDDPRQLPALPQLPRQEGAQRARSMASCISQKTRIQCLIMSYGRHVYSNGANI